MVLGLVVRVKKSVVVVPVFECFCVFDGECNDHCIHHKTVCTWLKMRRVREE